MKKINTPKRKLCQDLDNPTPRKVPRTSIYRPPHIPPSKKPQKSTQKKNPHPNFGQKMFMKIDKTIDLLVHRGLQKSTRSKKKIPPQPLCADTSTLKVPPSMPQSQEMTPQTHLPRRRSANFEKSLKLFQNLEDPPKKNPPNSPHEDRTTDPHHPRPTKCSNIVTKNARDDTNHARNEPRNIKIKVKNCSKLPHTPNQEIQNVKKTVQLQKNLQHFLTPNALSSDQSRPPPPTPKLEHCPQTSPSPPTSAEPTRPSPSSEISKIQNFGGKFRPANRNKSRRLHGQDRIRLVDGTVLSKTMDYQRKDSDFGPNETQ